MCLVDYEEIRRRPLIRVILAHDPNPVSRKVPNSELGIEFTSPLLDKKRRQDELHGRGWIVLQYLANDDTCFDRLSESDFIGQKVALDRIFEYPAGRIELVGVEFDR